MKSAILNIAVDNYIQQLSVWYNTFSGVSQIQLFTSDDSVKTELGAKASKDINYVWNFTPEQQLLGLYG